MGDQPDTTEDTAGTATPSEPSSEDVSGLKRTLEGLRSKLEKARERETKAVEANEAHAARIDELEAVLSKLRDEAKAKDLGVSGDEFEKAVAERSRREVEEVRTKLQGVIEKREAELGSLQKQIQSMTERSQTATLMRHLGAIGGDRIFPEALDEITTHAYKVFTVDDDDSFVPRDTNSFDDNGKSLTPESWLESMRPKRPYWFKSAGGTGSAGKGSTRSSAPTGGDPTKWTFAQKQQYIHEHGSDGYQKLIAESIARKNAAA